MLKGGAKLITRQQKEAVLEKLENDFSNSSLVMFINYSGFNVAMMRDLRRRLYSKYERGARFTVAKNTLIGRALSKVGYAEKDFQSILAGPTAVLYVLSDDPIEAIKITHSFSKEKKLEGIFKGGFLEGNYFTADDVSKLASLPTKEELYAMVVGRVQAPLTNLVYVLSGTMRKLLYALNAIHDKKSK